jgi:hypothetical protein
MGITARNVDIIVIKSGFHMINRDEMKNIVIKLFSTLQSNFASLSINLLKIEYLPTQNIQFIPHSKHIMYPLQKSTSQCCLEKKSLFTVKTI